MDLQRSRKIFYIVTAIIILSAVAIVAFFIYWFFQPQIVPSNETFVSFWLKNFAVLIGALSLAGWGLTTYQNAIEQRHLRFMENYPYLEVFPILSVDPLPLPIPKADTPDELRDFNLKYLQAMAPAQQFTGSDTEFRYLGIVLRNVGKGRITKISIEGSAQTPNRGVNPVAFRIQRRVFLNPEDPPLIFTILPIAGLPEYKVQLNKIEYGGHFISINNDFDGTREFSGKYPFSVPEERRVTLFYDNFENFPRGLDWTLDYWGKWQPTPYIFVQQPVGNDHYLVLRGDEAQFSQHHLNQGGAYKDLTNPPLPFGSTVKVTARVRAVPGTTGSIELWCHDLQPNPKNRRTGRITPGNDWQDISMLYTSTQSWYLRAHLHYYPGAGEIHVDRVIIEGLYT